MIPRHPRGETVQHHRYTAGVRNSHGQVVPGFEPPVDIAHVAVAPGSSNEPASGADQRVITQWSIYIPAGASAAPQDEFTVRGRRFKVDGDMSGEWAHPRSGNRPGSLVTLKVVTG